MTKANICRNCKHYTEKTRYCNYWREIKSPISTSVAFRKKKTYTKKMVGRW